MRILFLYAGRRKKIYDDSVKGTGPDTELLGLNFMTKHGIEADFLENRWTEFLRKISFELTQLPALFHLRRYDIVYSASGLLLLFLIKHILRWKKPLWIIYNNNLCRLLEKNKTGLKGFIIRKAIGSADAIVSPVRPQLAVLEKHGFDSGKSYFVPCSIDAKFYASNPESPRVIEGPYILSMGRDLGRDYPTFLKAIETLNTPVIIGAMKRNFPEGTVFPPNVRVTFFPKEQIPTLLHDALFVVVPIYKEERLLGSDFCGQYSILEAMAAGKAVITSAYSDVIRNGENGILVPPENPEALRKAIEFALENPELMEKMGAAGQKDVLGKLTSDRYAAELAKVFNAVMNSNSAVADP